MSAYPDRRRRKQPRWDPPRRSPREEREGRSSDRRDRFRPERGRAEERGINFSRRERPGGEPPELLNRDRYRPQRRSGDSRRLDRRSSEARVSLIRRPSPEHRHSPGDGPASGKAERFGPGISRSDDILWGRHTVQAALENGRPIHRIWCTGDIRCSSRFLQLLREAKAGGVLVEEVSWARLGQITSGAVHQGIALQTAAADSLSLSILIEACAEMPEPSLLMAVDGLTDPHNLGAIMRSAEALGAHGMVLPQRRAAGLTGSVAKVAAGALDYLPVARVVNLNRSLESLKEAGYRVIGLAEEGQLTLSEADLEGPLVVVTGSEDSGLSLLTRRHCDQLVRIPLRGMTPSLNASVATAIVVYEVARRGWMRGLSGQARAPRINRPKVAARSAPASSESPGTESPAAPQEAPVSMPVATPHPAAEPSSAEAFMDDISL